MRIESVVFLLMVAAAVSGCNRVDADFEMPVEKVDVLNGMIMRGISLSGEVAKGCIANDDAYVVERNGKKVLEEITRVVNVKGLSSADEFTGEVAKGSYVTFFIPDGSRDDVLPGDVVTSKTTSCQQKAAG